MDLSTKKLSKKEILELIAKIKKDPDDKYRLFADLGITTAGMAGAGAVAMVAGASTVPVGFGITTLTGAVLVASTPVGWVAGAAVVGGAATYGVTQAVRFKARQAGRREQLLQQLNEMLRDINYVETKAQTTEDEKTQFILFLEDPVRLNLISPEDASDLIQLIENGQITLFEAYRLVKDILKEFNADQKNTADVWLPRLLGGAQAS
jgi:hypothetical protein